MYVFQQVLITQIWCFHQVHRQIFQMLIRGHQIIILGLNIFILNIAQMPTLNSLRLNFNKLLSVIYSTSNNYTIKK